MTWRVRRASLRDKGVLTKLCRAAAGPDDYVIESLDDLILKGVVHVALGEDGRIVGMTAYRPCIDGSAWLGQARTHPDYRRQGVARAIVESFVGLARASGVPALRLWSEASNAEGVSTFTAIGFREVARFTHVVGAPARGTPKGKPRTFDEDLWRQVSGSSILAKGRGYVNHESCFVPATRAVVFALAVKGVFRAWNGNLIAVETHGGRGEDFWFKMWAGQPAELFSEACRHAHALGKSRVQTFLPHDRELLSEARRAGFEPGTWGREAILAELPVAPADLRKRVRPTYGELAAKRGAHAHAHGHEDPLGWAKWNA